jgi:soluble lytic murein transglycosylase-like protein
MSVTLGADGVVVDRSLAEANPSLSNEERTRIASAVIRYSTQYGLDPELVTAVMLVESDARPWARSPKGAVGLMQVMPHMMLPMGLAGNMTTIESNIEAGCFILANNIERLGEENGISAYFWGTDIRGVAYLEKVLRARERVRGLRTS